MINLMKLALIEKIQNEASPEIKKELPQINNEDIVLQAFKGFDKKKSVYTEILKHDIRFDKKREC